MLLKDTCWRCACLFVFCICVYSIYALHYVFACIRMSLYALHLCVKLHRSPYILINAVQVNFTHGGKRSLSNFVDLNSQKSGNVMLRNLDAIRLFILKQSWFTNLLLARPLSKAGRNVLCPISANSFFLLTMILGNPWQNELNATLEKCDQEYELYYFFHFTRLFCYIALISSLS